MAGLYGTLFTKPLNVRGSQSPGTPGERVSDRNRPRKSACVPDTVQVGGANCGLVLIRFEVCYLTPWGVFYSCSASFRGSLKLRADDKVSRPVNKPIGWPSTKTLLPSCAYRSAKVCLTNAVIGMMVIFP